MGVRVKNILLLLSRKDSKNTPPYARIMTVKASEVCRFIVFPETVCFLPADLVDDIPADD